MKKNIGFLLVEGFRNADIVSTDAILRLHPNNNVHYIGEESGYVMGSSQYPMKATKNFGDCPNLDVLVIPEMPEEALERNEVLEFILKQAWNCEYIIGISTGVLAMAKTRILEGCCATADKKSMERLSAYGVQSVHKDTFVKDGKYITAGPSTGAIEAAMYVMSELRGKTMVKFLELNLEYNPQAAFKDYPQQTLPEEGKKELKVAVVTPPGLYLPDVAGAVDVFTKLPNCKVYFVWKDKGDKKALVGPTLENNMTFDQCPQVDVLISGAITPTATVDEELINFFKKQEPRAKAVIGVCAGVFVPGAAGLLKDRRSVTNFHMLGMLKSVGANRYNTETVDDGKFFTAGPAIGSYEIGVQVVSRLFGKETAAYIEGEMLEYKPNPLFDMGTPRKAGKVRHGLSMCLSRPLIWLYKGKVRRTYKSNI